MSLKTKTFLKIAHIEEIPEDGGIAYLLPNEEQVALFKINNRIYAVENKCPHKKENVLARGIVGNKGEKIIVACPMHKKIFSLETGEAFDNDCEHLKVYHLIIDNNIIYMEWD